MNSAVFELAVAASGEARPGFGVLAAFVPSDETHGAIVVAGCDPRHDPGKPIESLAAAAFSYIFKALGRPNNLRWVIVDNWGRFFEAIPAWSDGGHADSVEFKRFPLGIGIDAFTKATGSYGEAALELLSSVIEGEGPDIVPTTTEEFLEAIACHASLPIPGNLHEMANRAVISNDLRSLIAAIHADPFIESVLIAYSNAASAQLATSQSQLAMPTNDLDVALQRIERPSLGFVVYLAEMLARYPQGVCANFDYQAYWRNALATGIAMRSLQPKYHIPLTMANECFAAGLLSGIGWLAIAQVYPNLMSEYIAQSQGQTPVAKAKLQKSVFPASIAQVSAVYVSRFEFPESIYCALTGATTPDGWAWYDCLAQAIRGGQALSPLEYLAIPTNLPIPEECRTEWQNWQPLFDLIGSRQ